MLSAGRGGPRPERSAERQDREKAEADRDLQVRRAVKREYFEKIKTMKFWTEVVNDDGPEGKDYALQVLDCIQSALRRK